jgi:uncharacterized C2H2 Zn-finger protein
MATEVRMLTDTWCDVHLLRDPDSTERVEATWSGVVTIDKLRRSLDLCEPCRAEFIGDLPDVLERFGTKLDPKAAVQATNNARPPSKQPDGKDHRCPRCEMEFDRRAGLTQHARNVHGKPLSVLEAELGLRPSSGERKAPELVNCPVCDKEMMGQAGLGSHLRTHKDDPRAQPALLKTG